ncbi:MAG TPA: DUF2157 domain-containing protein [Cytophagales bacterium]|nr:DUF2157 domain-containing protein [Cytophagales bacterium]
MRTSIHNLLKEEHLISEEQHAFIDAKAKNPLFSIFWELRVLLFLGVTLLSSGFGILIYENIDTIGHHTLIAIIVALCGVCFWYCFKHKKPFSFHLVESPTPVFDYILLLGCLLFLTLEGYLQFQYNIFGEKYGLATIIPTCAFFFFAYSFDHKGILGMGISGLALWFGIALAPKDIFDGNNYKEINLILSAIGLGVVLIVAAWQSNKEDFKKHFDFTYLNFGAHLIFISSILGMINFDYKWAFVLIVGFFCALFILYAKREQSFYFLLIAVFYAYFAFTYLFILLAENVDFAFEMFFMYFIISSAFIIFFFLNYKKFLTNTK